MSNNQNDNSGAGLVFIGFMMMLFFLYALACFIALVFTALSLLAWFRPLTLWRGFTIEPGEAHALIYGGLSGAVVVPVFAAFSAWLFGERVPDEFWFYLVTGGYPIGALIGIVLWAEYGAREPISPQQVYTAPTRIEPAPSSAAPFHYATWDDEAATSTPERHPCEGCAWLAANPDTPRMIR